MIFEDLLDDVGGYRCYQKTLVAVFLIPASMVIPWFSMNAIFMSSVPEHWCYVPEMAHSNLSMDAKRKLISPPQDPSCSMYDVDYSKVLLRKNLTLGREWPIKECNMGWEYDKTNYDATSVTKWNMVCKDDHFSSLVLSLTFLGTVIGTPFCGFLSDRLGRKPTFMFVSFLIAITDIGSVLSPYFWLYLLLRTLNGTCVTSVYTLTFLLLLELVSPQYRSRISSISTAAWTFGMCALPMIAWITRNWIYLSAVTTSAAAGLLLYWKIIPESPSWLISQGKYEDAYIMMNKIGKMNKIPPQKRAHLMERIHKLGEIVKNEKVSEQKSNPKDYFIYPKLRKRFILVTICWICGNMPYYGHQVNSRNLAGNEFLNFMYMSAVEVPTSLVTWMMLENIGRRWSAVVGFAVSTVSCLIPVLAPSGCKTAHVVAALMAKAGSASAYHTIYQLAPELFPTSIRAIGMGMCSTIGSGSTFFAPYIVYLAKFGFHVPFLCFAAIAVMGGVTALFLPETLNRKLPQVVADVEDYVSNQSFFSCGSDPDTNAEDSESVRMPPSRVLFPLPRTSLIDPVDIINILRRGSTNSVLSDGKEHFRDAITKEDDGGSDGLSKSKNIFPSQRSSVIDTVEIINILRRGSRDSILSDGKQDFGDAIMKESDGGSVRLPNSKNIFSSQRSSLMDTVELSKIIRRGTIDSTLSDGKQDFIVSITKEDDDGSVRLPNSKSIFSPQITSLMDTVKIINIVRRGSTESTLKNSKQDIRDAITKEGDGGSVRLHNSKNIFPSQFLMDTIEIINSHCRGSKDSVYTISGRDLKPH